jgi:hypothetical protein
MGERKGERERENERKRMCDDVVEIARERERDT